MIERRKDKKSRAVCEMIPVLVLHYQKGMSAKEVSYILQKPVKWVYRRITAIRKLIIT